MANVWQLENTRVTAFLPNFKLDGGDDWFEACLRVSPDTTEYRRAEGLKVDTAIIDRLSFTLLRRMGRVDWLISAEPAGDGEMVIGLSDPSKLPAFIAPIREWLAQLSEVTRVAFGLIAKLQARDKEDGYRLLAHYLPSITIDPIGSAELQYKINRPRTLPVAGEEVLINRLSSWNAIFVQKFVQEISSGQDGIGGGVVSRIDSVGHWARCELDINTDTKRTEAFSDQGKVAALDVLISLAVEILEQGDIP